MSYKLISTDIDGTLLSYTTHEISKYTLSVLSKIVSKGILLVPNTGRGDFQIPKELIDIGVRYCICTNGTIIKDLKENKIIFKSILDNNIAYQIYDYCIKNDFMLAAYINDDCYTQEKMYQYIPENISYLMRLTTTPTDTFPELIKDTNNQITKLCISFDPKYSSKILNDLSPLYPSLEFTSAMEYDIEIMNNDAGKDKGLLKLLEYLGIKQSEVIVMGDGENDISVLKLDDVYSIAPRNGNTKAIKYANNIVDSDEEDGPAKELEKIIL